MNQLDTRCINTIRVLAADAVQKANSGHPGAPMGMAPMAYALWQKEMRHSPRNPKWVNRDRFVLSSGHASALLYTLLHLYGYGLTMDDLKAFRQWGSKTPGHPEYGHTVGVETTTGPLGQGVANAVGFAMAEAHLAAKFNRPGFPIVDHYTYAICGDGCMMEGISSEAASLAGTLGLGKLILLYDDNDISIEGNTNIAMREDVPARFAAYGWHVQKVQDGNDADQIAAAVEAAKQDLRPSLIVVPTTIGYGCPAKAGKASAHGEPLGAENLAATKAFLGMSEESFHVDAEVYAHAAEKVEAGAADEQAWNDLFARYAQAYPDLAKEWDLWHADKLPFDFESDADLWSFDGPAATRATSGTVLNKLAKRVPNFFGGSADLAPSNKSDIKGAGDFSKENYAGGNLHFGVREHAMAAICNAIALHGGLRAYAATFFVFSDYMKNAMRLSALMKLPVTYILTHDSIGVGEDGPTHEPIEQLAGLRATPDLLVFRPADGKETTAGWEVALTSGLPTCLVLTRQNLPQYEGSGTAALKGGYVLCDSDKPTPDAILLASGSEVEQAMGAQKLLKEQGVDARVVSMPCMELFDKQDAAYRESVLPAAVRARVAVEAGATMPWYKYVGLDGAVIGLDHYGASAPAKLLFEQFGFTAQHVCEETLRVLGK
ncbi:MAG TPA: transketolase [Candidatus Onthenecus intestinigallinarum]|uniref:Transketolase n=1 Tax=Candidatus Onthenecus intestinigallinarum TaxID=2840875 RepID=A0A9D0Z822_9FIRM|nr:transketolase [Candidatus Onthenecus intestinigallinarum]